ncbi:uncharacterized protein LOC144116476 [Amblyomma americanum]
MGGHNFQHCSSQKGYGNKTHNTQHQTDEERGEAVTERAKDDLSRCIVEECQTRWRTIRDAYLKRKKRRRIDPKGQWSVLDRELGFLDHFLRPRTRRWALNGAARAVSPAEVAIEREQPDEDDEMREAAAAEAAAVAVAPAAPAQPCPVAMRPAAVLPHHLAAGGAAAQECSSDPEELFCLSLAADLKRLLPRERHMARMKMLQTLHDLEFGENIGEAALGEP